MVIGFSEVLNVKAKKFLNHACTNWRSQNPFAHFTQVHTTGNNTVISDCWRRLHTIVYNLKVTNI